MNKKVECVVVGGGASGLSAALVLGRARRSTVVVDAGQQSNLPAHGIGGLLGWDGRPPSELYAKGREELAGYGSVEVVDGTVVAGEETGDGFRLELEDGATLNARRLILAPGMDYGIEPLPGLDELWGDSVFHCPFCHGWEVRGKRLAVRANGDRGVHGAQLLKGWSDDVMVLTDGPADLTDEQKDLLAGLGVGIDERRLESLRSEGGKLSAVVFEGGGELARQGLLVTPKLRQRSELAAQLGLELEDTMLAERSIKVDEMRRTSNPAVFAAGDASGQMPQVATAISSGSFAAAAVVQSLLF